MSERPTPETDAELEMWRDGNIMHEMHKEEIEKAERERDNWEQAAAHYLDGMHYYRGLVQSIGETIGEAAYLQDDGGKVDSVLCAKVPELVVELKRERDEAREERDIAKLEFEEISYDLSDARNRIWQLEKQIEGLNNFANERFDEIQKVRKERDEAREAIPAGEWVAYEDHKKVHEKASRLLVAINKQLPIGCFTLISSQYYALANEIYGRDEAK